MQAFCEISSKCRYTVGMKTGRPSKRKRPPFGERLHEFREKAGLTQAQVAEGLGISARAYAFWERELVALRPDQIEKLARIFDVSIEELFLADSRPPNRKGGPEGKARRLFEQVNQLPRSQQSHVLAVVEAFVEKKASGGHS
jgi:transcriptional regulator with XRE-family HTH domain